MDIAYARSKALAGQSRAEHRLGYEGHNRRPLKTTMRKLQARRHRRFWNQLARAMAHRGGAVPLTA